MGFCDDCGISVRQDSLRGLLRRGGKVCRIRPCTGMEATARQIQYVVSPMMVRTQISLSAEDHRRAKERAAEAGISLSEYLRRLVARDLGEPRPKADVSRLFALGESGLTDVSSNHDAYVAEAIEAHFGLEPRQ